MTYIFYFLQLLQEFYIAAAEPTILTGIQFKEAKAEMETHPVTVETKISSKCLVKLKILQTFFVSYLLTPFVLFPPSNNFSFHLFRLIEIMDLFFLQSYFFVTLLHY